MSLSPYSSPLNKQMLTTDRDRVITAGCMMFLWQILRLQGPHVATIAAWMIMVCTMHNEKHPRGTAQVWSLCVLLLVGLRSEENCPGADLLFGHLEKCSDCLHGEFSHLNPPTSYTKVIRFWKLGQPCKLDSSPEIAQLGKSCTHLQLTPTPLRDCTTESTLHTLKAHPNNSQRLHNWVNPEDLEGSL